MINTPAVDLFRFLEQGEIHSGALGEVHKRLQVFWQAESTEAQPGMQKARPAARIHAHGSSDLSDIGAEALGKIGHHVGGGNFQREKRVRSVLDQLGAVDSGHQPGGSWSGGAGGSMDGAIEFAFEHRAINFLQLTFGCLILHADNNAVRVKKIPDGCALAQEFGVRSDSKSYAALAAINGKGALQLLASLRRDGAFFNH